MKKTVFWLVIASACAEALVFLFIGPGMVVWYEARLWLGSADRDSSTVPFSLLSGIFGNAKIAFRVWGIWQGLKAMFMLWAAWPARPRAK